MIPIQYQSSPILSALVDFIYQHYDAEAIIDGFYDKVLNIDTAQGFGLDWWGKIVNIGRYLTVEKRDKSFGFNVINFSFTPFNVAPFKNGAYGTYAYKMTDEAYRKLIIIKAMTNITTVNARAINTALQYLFDGKKCYVLDFNNMTARFLFSFYLEPYEKAIVMSELFPRPAGVMIDILEIPYPDVFGFEEGGIEDYAPFDSGTFYEDGLQ